MWAKEDKRGVVKADLSDSWAGGSAELRREKRRFVSWLQPIDPFPRPTECSFYIFLLKRFSLLNLFESREYAALKIGFLREPKVVTLWTLVVLTALQYQRGTRYTNNKITLPMFQRPQNIPATPLRNQINNQKLAPTHNALNFQQPCMKDYCHLSLVLSGPSVWNKSLIDTRSRGGKDQHRVKNGILTGLVDSQFQGWHKQPFTRTHTCRLEWPIKIIPRALLEEAGGAGEKDRWAESNSILLAVRRQCKPAHHLATVHIDH